MACIRSSGVVSTRIFLPAYETTMLGRVRLSRESVLWQTAQWQPIMGTPAEVYEREVLQQVFEAPLEVEIRGSGRPRVILGGNR